MPAVTSPKVFSRVTNHWGASSELALHTPKVNTQSGAHGQPPNTVKVARPFSRVGVYPEQPRSKAPLADQRKAAEENTDGNRGSGGLRQRQYWVGLALGIVILAVGLWLGFNVTCIGQMEGGTVCTLGGSEGADFAFVWSVIIAGALITVASSVEILWLGRKGHINNALGSE